MLGRRVDEIIGKSFFEFISWGWNERLFEFLQASCDAAQREPFSLTSAHGKEVSVQVSSTPFLFEERVAISLTIRDLTAAEQVEEALEQVEEPFPANMESGEALGPGELDKIKVRRSSAFGVLLGYRPDEKIGTEGWWKERIHPEDRPAVFRELERILRNGERYFNSTYRIRRADGSYAEVLDRAIMVSQERTGSYLLLGGLIDLTAQKKAAATKREISKKIVLAQEAERQRVARELHDGVNQILSSTSYRLQSVEQQAETSDNALIRKVREAKDLVDRAMKEVRLISRNLRPSELDDLGLNAALRSLAGEFQERTGITTTIDAQLFGKPVPPDVELTIYRIAQEALSNVQKHADARKVHLILRRGLTSISMKIRDNGKGFNPTEMRRGRSSGWGLDNMKQRAALFRGKVDVVSSESGGTEISLELPLSQNV
jgi:PAS domain S-box-containing protein